MADTFAEAPAILFKKRGAKGKAKIRQRPASPPQASNSDSASDEEEKAIKRSRSDNSAVIMATSKQAVANDTFMDQSIGGFKADRNKTLHDADEATRHSHFFDQAHKQPKFSMTEDHDEHFAKGTYQGLAHHSLFFGKKRDVPERSVGPVKAPSNIRTMTIMDLQPDVCKDYKKTGFCGFGDNCKFLHSREDYKQGWQLDKEWEEATRGLKKIDGTVVARADRQHGDAGGERKPRNDDEDLILHGIPFLCILCEEHYKAPVVTRCGHIFCEPCALTRYRQDPSCAACGAATNGVFKTARRLKGLLEGKRERIELQRRREEEADMEDDEGDEGDDEADDDGDEGGDE